MRGTILAFLAAVTLLLAVPNQGDARPWRYGGPRPYGAYYGRSYYRPYVAPYRVYRPDVYRAYRPYPNVYGPGYRPYDDRAFGPGYYYQPGISIGVY